MKQNKVILGIDLIFCLVIMPLIIMLVPIEKWIVHHTRFVITLIVYLYGLYFIYRTTNIPALFLKRKYSRILFIIVLLLGITTFLSNYPLPEDPDAKLPLELRRRLHSQTVWFFSLIVSGFSLSITATFELFRQILAKQAIEAEKNKAELALYKAQINPHFLFNTLNTLYGLVLTKSDNTESAFVKFSNILRYMYIHATDDTIDIASEIEYIRQYIDLQRLRLNEHSHVLFESKVDDPNTHIPPMLLITFVENAFKYGTSPDEDCDILIRIIVEKGSMQFETENTVMTRHTETDSAIGIENCRKRLELLYPHRFTLTTTEDNRNRFFVRLNLQLQ